MGETHKQLAIRTAELRQEATLVRYTSGNIRVSTGRRVRDPELKHDSVSGETVQTGVGKKRCEAVWSFVAEAILSRDTN